MVSVFFLSKFANLSLCLVPKNQCSRSLTCNFLPKNDIMVIDMYAKTEELMLKIADYNNVERNFFSKRMCAMFIIAIVGMVIYMGIDLLGLSGIEPYETIISIALGFVIGTLLTGFLYASRYIAKIKEAKARLARNLRRLK